MVESDFTNLVLIFIFGQKFVSALSLSFSCSTTFSTLGKLCISRTWPTKGDLESLAEHFSVFSYLLELRPNILNQFGYRLVNIVIPLNRG